MKIKIIFLFVTVMFYSCVSKTEDRVGQTHITKWHDDKRSAISITFDDGTINQFTVARPILNKLDLPGTFYILTGKINGSEKGKFIGRPALEIINETISIKTNASNFFERASAIGFIENGIAIDYHSNAGSLFESGEFDKAYALIDEGYKKLRKGELKVSNEIIFHDNKELDSTTWEDLKSYTIEGHEIASHTITHPKLAVLNEVNLLFELEQSRADIQKYLGGAYTFSAECPYGTEDERVMKYAHKIYPALRNRMPASYMDELNRGSRVDPVESNMEYVQWQRGALSNTSIKEMKSWVDTSTSQDNIWLVLVFHGVNNIGWEPKTGKELETYFSYIKEQEARVWVATFADVSKYVIERKNTRISSKYNDDRIEINISTDLNAKMYDVPITLKTYVPGNWKTASLDIDIGNPVVLSIQTDSLGKYVLYDALLDEKTLLLHNN